MEKSEWMRIITIGTIPVVGGAVAVALQKTATKYGHSFIYGSTTPYLMGIIGAVQNVASLLIFMLISGSETTDENKDNKQIIAFCLSHALSAGILVGLSALAAKVDLIGGRLTLFAGAVLTATSIIANSGIIMAGLYIDEKVKD